MRVLKSVAVDDMFERGSIKDADVYRLAQAIEKEGGVKESEVRCLLELHAHCRVQVPAWTDLLVRAVADYIVDHTAPEGYLTAEKAKWLIARISKDGRVETKAELDLLVRAIEKARWVPASLVVFALAQVREAVIRGDGPLRAGDAPMRGSISDREVELVRTLLCAFSDNGRIAISRGEVEILLDINDEIVPNRGCHAWTDLFVKALANVLMAAGGYAVPDRATALQSRLAGDAGPGASSLEASVDASLGTLRSAYGDQTQEERSLARLERQRIEIVTGEDVAGADAPWLAVRLLGDSALSAEEEAVVSYFRRERLIGVPLLAAASARSGRAA